MNYEPIWKNAVFCIRGSAQRCKWTDTAWKVKKNMLTRFADREEMIVVDTYEDAGKSGKSIEGRPVLSKKCSEILRMAWTLTIF